MTQMPIGLAWKQALTCTTYCSNAVDAVYRAQYKVFPVSFSFDTNNITHASDLADECVP